MTKYTEAIWQTGIGGYGNKKQENLNELVINVDRPSPEDTVGPQVDYSTSSYDETTTVYFKHLDLRLIEHIQDADIVVGCVAWLTHTDILQALAKKTGVSLIVQKEDFLRPDLHAGNGWKAQLHRLYSALPSTLSRLDGGLAGTTIYQMSCCCDPTLPSVRCIGNLNTEKAPASPRAHHKFVVFCRSLPHEEHQALDYYPYAVWTGSFNFTRNAVASFENAVLLRDRKIVDAFFHEYAQLAALSEPLNWEHLWASPDWRIGT